MDAHHHEQRDDRHLLLWVDGPVAIALEYLKTLHCHAVSGLELARVSDRQRSHHLRGDVGLGLALDVELVEYGISGLR